MRDLHQLDTFRMTDAKTKAVFGGWTGDGSMGAFVVASPVDGAALRIIASTGFGWEHVSVSRRNRCPNWTEMEAVKRLFFTETETCMQLHVPPGEHVNYHPYVLHLWRPLKADIPQPPSWMVGPGGKDGDGPKESDNGKEG